jgi:hypothetical protein
MSTADQRRDGRGQDSRRRGALAWFAGNTEKVRAERHSLDKDFRSGRSPPNARRARRPDVGLGVRAEPGGKSYLISARGGGTSPLMADFDGKLFEASRTSTPKAARRRPASSRFTLRRAKTTAGLPVALRLLSQTDIVKIIGNSYYSDCDQAENAHRRGHRQALRGAAVYAQPQASAA